MFMVPTYIFAIAAADKAFLAVIIGSIVMLVAITKRLHSHREAAAAQNTLAYRERFQQMKVEAAAKYGPVELLRPEMELDDDPELFDRAWREFQQDHGGHVTASR
jgi:hypothetical protein